MPASRSVTALAKVEARRLAKHPAFLIGLVLTVYFLATLTRTRDYYNIAIVPAFFLGMFGMVAMFRLTRSMEKLEEAVGTTPAGVQDRVRALCLATLLPGVLGVLAFVTVLVHHGDVPTYAQGAWSASDRFAIFFGEIVVACVGGPLLGIAAARWLRFPGAVVVPFAAILFVVLTGEGLTDGAPQAWWSTLARLVSPWTQFTTIADNEQRVGSWLGSPWLWVGWLVALCVLAVLAALLKDADAADRSRFLRMGAVVGAVGLVFLVLAVVLGPDQATMHTPSGVTTLTSEGIEG